MQRLVLTIAALLFGAHTCLAQVSTIGTTAMGLPSTPGTIVSSPLSGLSPFSAVTQPNVPDTTLAPVPLALNPTTSGTVVTCAPPSGQITPATPTVAVTSLSTVSGTAGTTPSAAVPLGSILTPVTGSTTGTTPPISPLGSSSTTTCSSIPGGPPTNGAALPLSTPEIAANPPPGTIQPGITELGSTSINPTLTVVPTPNATTCAQSVTINLAAPAMMAPANATGAAATPGVSPPPGC